MCGYIAMVVILLFVVVAVSTEYPQKSWNSAGHKLIKMLFYDFYDYLCMIYNLTSICLNFTRITYSNHFPLSPMLKQFTMVTAILDFRSSHIQIHIRSTNLQVCLQLSDVVLWRSFYFSIALLLHTIFCVDGLYGYPNDTKTANCKYDHSRMNETSITPRQLQKVVRCVVSDQIKVITKLPNSEQSYKGKVKTHNYIKTKSVNNRKTVKTVMTLTWYRHF